MTKRFVPAQRDPVHQAAFRLCAVWPRWRASPGSVPYAVVASAVRDLTAALEEANGGNEGKGDRGLET